MANDRGALSKGSNEGGKKAYMLGGRFLMTEKRTLTSRQRQHCCDMCGEKYPPLSSSPHMRATSDTTKTAQNPPTFGSAVRRGQDEARQKGRGGAPLAGRRFLTASNSPQPQKPEKAVELNENGGGEKKFLQATVMVVA